MPEQTSLTDLERIAAGQTQGDSFAASAAPPAPSRPITPEQAALDELEQYEATTAPEAPPNGENAAGGAPPEESDPNYRRSVESDAIASRASASVAPSIASGAYAMGGGRYRRRIGIALLIAFVVGGATLWIRGVGTSGPPARSELDAHREAERVLMQDQDKAISTLLGRLQRQVRSDGEMILIVEGPPLNTLDAFPSRVSWHIECDSLGLSVDFTGSGTLENSPGAVEITLTDAALTLDQCRGLVPPVAAMLAGFGGR